MTAHAYRRSSIAALVLAAAVLLQPSRLDGQVAREAPASTETVIKGRAPVNEEVLRVKLPRPREAVLANGLRLLVLEDRRVPRITVELYLPGAGGYYDPADLSGLAVITAATMREGTSSRSSTQIAEQLDTIAASLTISSTMAGTEATLAGAVLTEHARALFDIMGDIVAHPSFPHAELERYRQRTKPTLIQQQSNAATLGTGMLARIAYGSHPAGRVSIPAATLERVTREDLAAFHGRHYAPDHALIAIAGDISFVEARRMAAVSFGEWERAGEPRPSVAPATFTSPSRIFIVERGHAVQTSLFVGAPAVERTNPDFEVLSLMNRVLGGAGGRLFMALRETKGYAYSASSRLTSEPWGSTWLGATSVRVEVTREALRELLAEIERMRSEDVPVRELRDRQRALVGNFALSLENPQQMLGYYVESWRYALRPDYWDGYARRIAAVTPAQVRAAARTWLDPARLQIVAVGDAPRISEMLASFGRIERYDSEGRPVAGARD